MRCALKKAAFVAAFFISLPVLALERAAVEKLAFGEGDERIAAIAALVAEGDPKAREVLKALAEGEMQTSGKQVFIVRGDKAIDAFTGPLVFQTTLNWPSALTSPMNTAL